ncbi:unnamed protein product [Periconia digitata]|uniref:Cytochrome P450 n=1 Tax=Periconia digitata TaxID=1303443 RepID=A0A9W4UAI1_9PLEO|nr:unnamed protein product [Periconia digitata]
MTLSVVYGGIVLVALLFVAPKLQALHRNYRAARATGLPIVVFPFDPDSLIHTIFSDPLRPVLRRLLPASLYATFEISTFGWEFRDKSAVHERLGPNFILVSPGLNRFICADPATGQNILARRKDFVHPDISLKAMNFLGKNIITNNDEAWSRQRRIVAPALSERISEEVWKVSAEHASSLTDILLSNGPLTTKTIPGLRAIAINVLTRIAYGHKKPFALPSSTYDPKAELSYVDGICLCTEFLVVAAFAPWRMLRWSVMPTSMQTLGVALQRLPELTKNMLDQVRQSSAMVTSVDSTTHAGPHKGPDPILKTFARLSDEQDDNAAKGDGKTGRSYLTEEEIAGNLFIFTAAGFDTTANTMGYATTLLAAYPKWQEWIQEEIDGVLSRPQNDEEKSLPDYATAFPQLKRCLAVMFETLRLFPPVTTVMRTTTTNQLITTRNSAANSFTLGAPCAVHVNIMALHTSAAIWGPDALDFKPSRWLQPATNNDTREDIITPPRGVFLPWSNGPRTCPGQKMSQVEFVSVMATIFGQCRVDPIPKDDESVQQARQKLLDLTQDSHPVLTLQMSRPEEIHLKWVRRDIGSHL